MPTKVIVTSEGGMKRQYQEGWTAIRKAIDRLIASDAVKGITTELKLLDDASLGRWKAKGRSSESFKDAIDHVWGMNNSPDYLLILGGPHIVPHQDLRNPIRDGDENVPSDLPYACDSPASDDPETFLGPTRVVGRLPNLPGDNEAKLVELLKRAAQWKPNASSQRRGFFGISAEEWKKSTKMSLASLFGAKAAPRTSPAGGPLWSKGELSPVFHFINCHGGSVDPQYYGQRGRSFFPVAHQSAHLGGNVASGTVVAAECCYGAELYDTKGGAVGISSVYLREGAIGFLGSTNIAYGPADGNGEADLICRDFMASVLAGATLGRALLEARLSFVATANPLSPAGLKTLAQFLLLGDPSLRALTVSSKVRRNVTPKGVTFQASVRGDLLSKAATLSKGVDTAASRPDTRSPKEVNGRMEAAARAAGYVPVSEAQAYSVRPGSDPVSRSALSKKAYSPTRYHVLLAVPPQPMVGGKSSAGAKTRTEPPKPPGVRDDLLLVAREVGGRVVNIEHLYAHRHGRSRDERYPV